MSGLPTFGRADAIRTHTEWILNPLPAAYWDTAPNKIVFLFYEYIMFIILNKTYNYVYFYKH